MDSTPAGMADAVANLSDSDKILVLTSKPFENTKAFWRSAIGIYPGESRAGALYSLAIQNWVAAGSPGRAPPLSGGGGINVWAARGPNRLVEVPVAVYEDYVENHQFNH